MAYLSPSEAQNALRQLSDAALERETELDQFCTTPDLRDTEDKNDSRAPLYDTFYQEGGAGAILSMTNFDPQQCDTLWGHMQDYVLENFNGERGTRTKHIGCDVFFMTLTFLKHASQWDHAARMFNMKGPTFERPIMKFILIPSEFVYEAFLKNGVVDWSMAAMLARDWKFKNFRFARYATDVTFQQEFRPSGSVQKGKSTLARNTNYMVTK